MLGESVWDRERVCNEMKAGLREREREREREKGIDDKFAPPMNKKR